MPYTSQKPEIASTNKQTIRPTPPPFSLLTLKHPSPRPFILWLPLPGEVVAMATSFLQLTSFGLLGFIVFYLVAYLRSPLKDIPGPFFAKFTNWWRFFDHYNATQTLTQRRLHENLGSAVRIGPNFVSLNDPALLKTVYSTRGSFLKVSSSGAPELQRRV